jgi:hypothetical protein
MAKVESIVFGFSTFFFAAKQYGLRTNLATAVG